MKAIADKMPSLYESNRGKPMPSLNHGIIQANIIILIGSLYADKYRVISELTTKLDEDKQVPYIAIYAKNNVHIRFNARKDQISTNEVPLGVIEILSPPQNFAELVDKSTSFFASGVKSYWLVVPPVQTVYVFSEPDEFEIFSKLDVLKDGQLGIELKLGEVFS
ncbi:MAG: Uma2 family endonuclease [Chitinophagales bacterium]